MNHFQSSIQPTIVTPPSQTQPVESRQAQVSANSWGRTVTTFFTAFFESLDPREVAPKYKDPAKQVGLPSIGFDKIDHSCGEPKRSVDYAIDVLEFSSLLLKLSPLTTSGGYVDCAIGAFNLLKPCLKELAHQSSDKLHSSLVRYFEDTNTANSQSSSRTPLASGALTKLIVQAAAISTVIGASKASAIGSSAGRPIHILDATTLSEIGVDPDLPLDGHYVLAVNIDASQIKKPIGSQKNPFTGYINGKGRSISNVSQCFIQSLIGKISNVAFINADVQSAEPAGVVACQASGNSAIRFVIVRSSNVSTHANNASAGGIVGEATGNALIGRSAVVSSTVQSSGSQASVGLVAGKVAGNTVIEYPMVFASSAKTSGEFSPCAAVTGDMSESATIKALIIRNTHVSTSGSHCAAAIGAGVIKGPSTKIYALDISGSSVKTQGNQSSLAFAAGVSLNSTMHHVNVLESSLEGTGDHTTQGLIAGGAYGYSTIGDALVLRSTSKSTSNSSVNGVVVGESDQTIHLDFITVAESNLTFGTKVHGDPLEKPLTLCNSKINGKQFSTGDCNQAINHECDYLNLFQVSHEPPASQSMGYAEYLRGFRHALCQGKEGNLSPHPESPSTATRDALLAAGTSGSVALLASLYSIKQWYSGYQNGIRGQDLLWRPLTQAKAFFFAPCRPTPEVEPEVEPEFEQVPLRQIESLGNNGG